MCPACSSKQLMIKLPKGIETIMIYLTGKRKFVCMSCSNKFRAPDRRRVPRDSEELVRAQLLRS